jgi:hypothetical protein
LARNRGSGAAAVIALRREADIGTMDRYRPISVENAPMDYVAS